MSFYVWIVRDHADLEATVEAVLRERFGEGLHPGAALQFSAPWFPNELLRNGPPVPALRTVGLVTRDRRGRMLTDKAFEIGVRHPDSSIHRGAPFYPGDLAASRLSRRLGGLLALAHSDHPTEAYAARFVAGKCVGAIYLRDRERLARFDGSGVQEFEEPSLFPERDRAGVLLGGLTHFIGEPLNAEVEERLTLADVIAWGVEEGELLPLE